MAVPLGRLAFVRTGTSSSSFALHLRRPLSSSWALKTAYSSNGDASMSSVSSLHSRALLGPFDAARRLFYSRAPSPASPSARRSMAAPVSFSISALSPHLPAGLAGHGQSLLLPRFSALSPSASRSVALFPLIRTRFPQRTFFSFPPSLASTSPAATAKASAPASTSSSEKTASESEQDNSNTDHPDPDPSPEQPRTLRERFRLLTKKYGWYALGVYLIISFLDFSAVFVAIHLLGADYVRDVEDWVRERLPFGNVGGGEADVGASSASQDAHEDGGERGQERKPGAGETGSSLLWTEAILAYTIHKSLLLPIRIGLTAAITPSIVKWLAKVGWAKRFKKAGAVAKQGAKDAVGRARKAGGGASKSQ